MSARIRIGISSCLLGQAVRFDGGHKHNGYITETLGQFFVFVVEKQGEMTVAKQRPVTLGNLVGNDYVLLTGLKAGDQLIVSGIQKIGDGAPVMVGAPAAPPKAS